MTNRRFWLLLGVGVVAFIGLALTFAAVLLNRSREEVVLPLVTQSTQRPMPEWAALTQRGGTRLAMHGDRLWILDTQTAGVYSADLGTTWQPNTFNDTLHIVATDPNNGVWYAAGQTAFYRSADQGVTWAKILTPTTHLQQPSLVVTNRSSVFVTSGNQCQLQRSLDADLTWEILPLPTSDCFPTQIVASPSFGSDQTLYTLTANQGIYVSHDAGASWQTLTKENVAQFVIDPTHPQRMAAIIFNRLHRSLDGGVTWELLQLSQNGPFEVTAVAMTPNGIVIGGTLSGQVFDSADFGTTWRLIGRTDAKGIRALAATNLTIYVLTPNQLLAGYLPGSPRTSVLKVVTSEPTFGLTSTQIASKHIPTTTLPTAEATVTRFPTLEPTPTLSPTIAPTSTPTPVEATSLPQPSATPTPFPATSEPTPTSTSTPTVSPTPMATAAPPTEVPTPTPTAFIDAEIVTPQASGAAIRVGGWSLDSQWVAFWLSSADDVVQNPQNPSGTLHFYNVSAQTVCAIDSLHTQSPHDNDIQWQSDGTLWVTVDAVIYHGQPCLPDSFVVYSPPTPEPEPNGELSLDGQLRALTEMTAKENGILTLQTVIVNSDNLVQQSVTWRIDERLGNEPTTFYGEWVSRSQYLIHETLRQGPLLLDAEHGIIAVLPALFGIDPIPTQLNSDGYAHIAHALPALEPNQFHLMLSSVGTEANFPAVQLYHAELNETETLPYQYVWFPAFSAVAAPATNLLVLWERGISNNSEVNILYTRSVEDVGGNWEQLAFDVNQSLWGSDSFVYAQSNRFIAWHTVSANQTVRRYDAQLFYITPVELAPNENAVVAIGRSVDQTVEGLFILSR